MVLLGSPSPKGLLSTDYFEKKNTVSLFVVVYRLIKFQKNQINSVDEGGDEKILYMYIRSIDLFDLFFLVITSLQLNQSL
jgi:hypothetical protein